MRIATGIIALSVILCSLGCSRDSDQPWDARSGSEDRGESHGWVVEQVASSNSIPGILRHMEAKPQGWNTIPLSEEVSLSWDYTGSFLDSDTLSRMNALEDALEPLSSGPDSYMVLIITIDHRREWCFYTRDYPQFMEKVNSLLAGEARFPVSIVHSHDPEWKYWNLFVRSPMAEKIERPES